MSVWPEVFASPMPTMMPWSVDSIGVRMGAIAGGVVDVSTVWSAANRALFIPFALGKPATITRIFWFNGATVSGNVDCGVYDAAGTRLISSGSTAQAGTTAIQSVDVTDTLIGPGQYYLALAMDNVTGTIRIRTLGNVVLSKSVGMAAMETAFPLPTTVTLITTPVDSIPSCGVIFSPRTVI